MPTKDAFTWNPETDAKLAALLFAPGKCGVKEHAEWADLLGVPTPGGIRNRVDKLKSNRKKLLEDMGITSAPGAGGDEDAGAGTPKKTPKKDVGATPKKENVGKKATPKKKKRGAEEVDGDGGVDTDKQGKKMRLGGDGDGDEDEELLKLAGVKREALEDDL